MQRLSQLLPASALRLSTALRPGLYLSQTNILPRAALTSYTRLLYTATDSSHPVNHELETRIPVAKTIDERWRENSRRALDDARNHPPANPYSGRTVLNPSGKNLSGTFRKLEGILIRNQVRKQLRMTERHEKKGVKRRRLSSERWRKRFADEVRKKVQLVIKIKDRGA